MDVRAFEAELEARVDAIFRGNPRLDDHRGTHPGAKSSLGDPFAGTWFLAEFPSLGRIEQPGFAPTDPNGQWNVSPGDKLFRVALFEAGFKTTLPEAPGGWRCYVTNLIKAAEYAEARKERKPFAAKLNDAETWAPVLRWQMDIGRPTRIVLMGGTVTDLFRYLLDIGLLTMLPQVERIDSYAYVASRPRGPLGPMHPDRVAAYKHSIAAIAERAGIGPEARPD